jgi:hypothetical protein
MRISIDPISDAACLASAANNIINFVSGLRSCLADILSSQISKPPSCDQCAQEFDVAEKVENVTNAATSAASQAKGAVESVVGDVGNVLGSIF